VIGKREKRKEREKRNGRGGKEGDIYALKLPHPLAKNWRTCKCATTQGRLLRLDGNDWPIEWGERSRKKSVKLGDGDDVVRRERERKRGSVAEMVIGRAGASSSWEVLIRSEAGLCSAEKSLLSPGFSTKNWPRE
jgi:hypothetical protein